MTRSRTALTAVLFSLTILLGLSLFAIHNPGSPSSVWSSFQEIFRNEHRAADIQKPSPSKIIENIRSRVPDWSESLTANKDVIVYAALLALGVMAVFLLLASSSRKKADPKDAVLETLRAEKEKAENLARVKAEFLNHVSHELRTPLAVIIGYVECITDGLYGQVGAKHQEILEIVSKQSSQLKEMIDQILIYSRLDSNRQTVRIGDFSLNDLVEQLKDTFAFLCKQKELELRWEVSSQGVTISSDLDCLKEILSNLLQNAVKYTDRGSITVGAKTVGENIRFDITDTGLGIPKNYLINIFEPFVQVHRSSTEMSRGGIGLGLSIVKKHVEQIKGNISVTSELGRGSTFTVIIPRVFEKQSARKQLFALARLPHSGRNAKALPEPQAASGGAGQRIVG